MKPIIINLWHGVPLKRIEYDDPLIAVNKFGQRKDIVGLIYNILVNKDDYHAVTSDYDSQKRQSSFRLKPEQCAIVGNPRLDAIYNHFKNEEIFIEKDFENIENFKKQNKKIFLYMPTFRDTKKDISGWLQSKTVHNFLQNNNIILACKLHTNDKSIVDVCCENIYKINSNSDIYSLLKYSDALITDYSSIYFDYLLLDKPIIYYPLDLEEYQTKCRGFYAPYDELTAGVKAYNEQELIKAIQDVINGIDNYKEERKVLRDKMFKYQDGRNCERVLEWIKSLDK